MKCALKYSVLHTGECLPALRHSDQTEAVCAVCTILCFVWIQMSSSSIPRSCSVEKENISSFKTRLYQVSPFHTENLQCGQGRYKLFTKMAVTGFTNHHFRSYIEVVDKEDIIFHNKALSGFTFQCLANLFK